MIDYTTRYPEAVALPSIETERVAEALIAMFSRVGIPSENNKVLLQWNGPYEVLEVVNAMNYKINVKGVVNTLYLSR